MVSNIMVAEFTQKHWKLQDVLELTFHSVERKTENQKVMISNFESAVDYIVILIISNCYALTYRSHSSFPKMKMM